jgi:hypothetical protein
MTATFSDRARPPHLLTFWLCWMLAALIGGATAALGGDTMRAVVLGVAAVALLQAVMLPASGVVATAWFLVSAAAGTLGLWLATIGGIAVASGPSGPGWQEGLAVWAVVSGLGGLVLGIAQGALLGRWPTALTWTATNALAAGIAWPAGLALGYRHGADVAARMSHMTAWLGPNLDVPVSAATLSAGVALAATFHAAATGLVLAILLRREVGARRAERVTLRRFPTIPAQHR